MRTLSRLVAILGAAAVLVAASSAGAAPRGTLTAAEYRQLSVETAALNRSVSSKSVNWRRARAACRAVGAATVLLRSQRASCLDSMAVLDALASFPPAQRRCAALAKRSTGTGTTTTGTTPATTTTGSTTTPAEAAVIRLMVCMSPRYRRLAGYAKRLDRAAISARRSVLARGFSGSCLAALAPTRGDLRRARLFSASTDRLAADVTLLIRVSERRAPASDFNQAKIDSDVRQFEHSATAVLDEHGQPKLSVCSHE